MNMDRFKFRVWDKENECYQQDEADHCIINHKGELVCVFWGDGDTMQTQYVESKNAIIEQCTGLKDKNGKLIYEGDKVICRKYVAGNWIDVIIERGYVAMEYGAFGLYRQQGYYRPFKDWLEDYELEIIGNIHESEAKSE